MLRAVLIASLALGGCGREQRNAGPSPPDAAPAADKEPQRALTLADGGVPRLGCPAALAPAGGPLSGSVVEIDDGAPVAGVTVEAASADGQPLGRVVTDAGGAFSGITVPAGGA